MIRERILNFQPLNNRNRRNRQIPGTMFGGENKEQHTKSKLQV